MLLSTLLSICVALDLNHLGDWTLIGFILQTLPHISNNNQIHLFFRLCDFTFTGFISFIRLLVFLSSCFCKSLRSVCIRVICRTFCLGFFVHVFCSISPLIDLFVKVFWSLGYVSWYCNNLPVFTSCPLLVLWHQEPLTDQCPWTYGQKTQAVIRLCVWSQ